MSRTNMMKPHFVYLLLLLLIASQTFRVFRVSDAAKRRIHISDELDDVVDDEEDEAWREWGKTEKKPDFDPPPTDFNKMSVSEIQEEMMKRQFGPVFGFVKLRPGTGWSKDIVSEIAMKWTNVARTGAIEAKFMGVDLSTIMFTMEKGQDAIELKEFLLRQSEAYEVKMGDQLFRREGDPPFEEIVEKLRAEKSKSGDAVSKKGENKDEL